MCAAVEEPEGFSMLVAVSTAGVSRAGVLMLAAVSAVEVNVLEEAKAVGVSAVATAERGGGRLSSTNRRHCQK